MTTCDKFEQTVMEGQLCYSLDITKLGRKQSKPGKRNGLFLLLDTNPYQLNLTQRELSASRVEEQSFKVFIHTLAQFASFGPGSYGMSALKKMSSTKSFEQLPDHQKKCHAHNREECQTQKYLSQVQKECNCVPWALGTDQNENQVKNGPPQSPLHFSGLLWPREGSVCC